MLIIIEGIDGAGKTTLANLIHAQLNKLAPNDLVTRLHKGPPTGSALEEYELPLQDYRPGDKKHVIADRWHIGELVYGPVLRGKTILTGADEIHVDKFLAARGAILIHPVANLATVQARIETRGDDLVKPEMLDTLQQRYWDTFTKQKLITWQFTWTEEEHREHELVTALILQAARDEEVKTIHLSGFPSYVGPSDPDVLILGERKNPKGDDRWEAAFTPGDGTSGRYLLNHLPSSIARSSGIANAMEENVKLLVHILGNPPVVTLGNIAHKKLTDEGIPHGAVPHPQYVRRFHHHHGYAYGQTIRRAAFLGEDLRSWRP